MAVNKILAPSAAVASFLGATLVPGVAAAQDTNSSLVLSFDGSVGRGDVSNAYGEAKIGAGFTPFDDDTSFVGSIGLSRSINDAWDWNVSVSRLESFDNVIGGTDGINSVSWGQSGARSTAEFTIGRHIAAGDLKARLGLGLAYANATADKGLDVTNGSFAWQSDIDTKFQGVGPRLTADLQSAPLSANGKLSVIGGADFSMLAGKYKHSKGLEAYNGIDSFSFSNSETSSGKMTTAGIQLGLQYDANEKTAFRAGVRHDVTKMDRVFLTGEGGPLATDTTTVSDGVTSFFVGMDVSF